MAAIPNLDSLKVFYYAAKYQSITRAAKELFLSQPSATRTIHALEAQMEYQLFVRSPQGVALTPEGQMFYQSLIPAMESIENAVEEMGKMRRLEKGFVHVGVNNLAAEYILKVAIDTFSDRYPGVTITMSRVDLKRVEESLCNGWLDFVLHIDMDDEPTGSDFLAETQLMKQEVGDFPDAFLVGARYAYLAQRPHTPGELAALPLIIPLEAHDASRYYLKLLRGTESATPIDITVDGAQSRLALARRNLGLTHFPAAFVRDQLSRRELFVVKSDLPMRNNVVSVFSAGEELPNLAAQKLMETLLQFKK